MERQEEIAEVIGAALAVPEKHLIGADQGDRVGGAETPQRLADRLDERRCLQGGAYLVGSEIRLAAEGLPQLVPQVWGAEDALPGYGQLDHAVQLHTEKLATQVLWRCRIRTAPVRRGAPRRGPSHSLRAAFRSSAGPCRPAGMELGGEPKN